MDISKLPKTPEITQKINSNTVGFAPEIGRYFDAQLWIEAAVMDSVGAFMANASQAQLEQPNFKSGVAKIRDGATQTIYGALTTLPVEGLSDTWRRDRLPALAAVAPIAAHFLLADQARSLSAAATEVAGRMTDPAVKGVDVACFDGGAALSIARSIGKYNRHALADCPVRALFVE